MKIAVVGGGATGLTAAYELAKGGHTVSVFEADNVLGGLASVKDVGGGGLSSNGDEPVDESEHASGGKPGAGSAGTMGSVPLERIYHHIFTSDTFLIELAEELGIGDKMIWTKPIDGFYTGGELYPFTSPKDLLSFSPLPFWARVSMGLLVLRSRFVKNFESLENQTAGEWVAKMAGKCVYEKVWKPLIYSKFDVDAENVAAVWLWNKFKLRGATRDKNISQEMLGYMNGSFGLLYDKLAERIIELGGSIKTDAEVTKIAKTMEGIAVVANGEEAVFDKVLFTAAPEKLVKICDDISDKGKPFAEYLEKIGKIKYKANICALLLMKKSLSKYYWTTVADDGLPFVAVIEHTNIMPNELYGGANVVYLTRYLDSTDELYNKTDEEIQCIFCDGLKKMFENFSEDDVIDCEVFRSQHSQPVVKLQYSKIIPEVATPVSGLYLSSMAQIYPEDRGQNYAIRAGREAANIILQN